jgi:hypothetical protein
MDETTELPSGTIDSWNDDQWLTFKSWLKNILYTNIVEILFTKTDGTERLMNCTLRGDMIKLKPVVLDFEEMSENKTTTATIKIRKTPKQSENTLRVYDLDKSEWRSFRIRSLKNIYTLILKYGK